MNRLGARCLGLATGCLLWASPAVFADEVDDIDRLFASGQFSLALHRADQVLATRPKDRRVRFLKGLILSEQGKSTEAIDVFTALSADHPELPEPHNNLGVLYSRQGQYGFAKRALEAAVRANPNYATAHENLGDVYAKLAGEAYAKALQIDGKNHVGAATKLSIMHGLFSQEPAADHGAGKSKPAARPAHPPSPSSTLPVTP